MANAYIRAKSPKGNVGVTDVVDAGELSAYSPGVLSGFAAASAASWTLQIGGVTGTQDVAVAKNPAGESELLVGTAGQSIAFIIGGAPGTPGQSRTDALVIYKDPFTTSVVNNGIDVVDYQVVAGTAATTGSQVPPDDAAIRAAIPTGSLKFVVVLGYVTVANGAGSVSTSNFFKNPALLSTQVVANVTARNLITPIAGMRVYRVDAQAYETYNGTSWVQEWTEIGRTTLTVAGDTISIPSMIAKKYMRMYFAVTSTGGTLNPAVRFNNDTGANYSYDYSANYGAGVTVASQTSLAGLAVAVAGFHSGVYDIVNIAAQRKLLQGRGYNDANAGVASGSNSIEVVGKWGNTADQITRGDLVNLGTGDFAIGSQFWVEGKD